MKLWQRYKCDKRILDISVSKKKMETMGKKLLTKTSKCEVLPFCYKTIDGETSFSCQAIISFKQRLSCGEHTLARHSRVLLVYLLTMWYRYIFFKKPKIPSIANED